ncbi:MAG: ATP-binding protein [Deltaproteobacteria bacterium]|nr:ATP-binding protein [Deltaproteobacteria bacterium]
MDIEPNAAIELFFPSPSFRYVIFEAIANALDAKASQIHISIDIQAFDKPDTLRIKITDNGDGFSMDNFNRFKTLLQPRDTYHKGLGRLIFLKYFKEIDVESTWNGGKREFTYEKNFKGKSTIKQTDDKSKKTILTFKSFIGERIKSYEDLKPDSLKPHIIDHFLPTFLEMKRKGDAFNIKIDLNTDETNPQKEFFPHESNINAGDLPVMQEKVIKDAQIDSISDIKMYYYVSSSENAKTYLTAASIDGRTVPLKLLPESSFPPNYKCVFLFESELFRSKADSSRQKLVLPENIDDKYLFSVLRQNIGTVLNKTIPEITKINTDTKNQLEEKFPHLLGFFEADTVGLVDKDESLTTAQQRFFKEQKKVLQSDGVNEEMYKKSLEFSSRALTEYILYREKIINRMKGMTENNTESDIHNLIVPRFNEFDKNSLIDDIYRNNAWLLDDKFMGFRSILSEKRMKKIINSIRLEDEDYKDDGRPDIALIFSGDPKDEKYVDVVVVEIKKKTDDEKENLNAISQLLSRATKLVKHCPNIQRIWYYAVIQINDSLGELLRQYNWAPLYSKGKIYYQEYKTFNSDKNIVPTPTFAISFDAIVADAEARNHTFLEILRNGMREYINKNTY